MAKRMKIYFDGGCRPNPGRIEIAIVARGLAHIEHDAGQGTSMDAEWLALIAALRHARALGAGDYVLLGDAKAVIEQATGIVVPRRTNAHHCDSFHAILAGDDRPRIRYIKRTQNLAGIALARQRVW